MKTADATRTSTTVRRMAEAIIATVTLIAATPAQAQPASGKAGEILAPADGPTTNRQLPKITLSAGRDSIIAGLEDLVLSLTREGALQDSLRVTLDLTQEQEWIQPMPYTATFAAGEATVVDSIVPKGMAAARLQSGNVVVTVGSVAGYDTDDATATVHMIALGGPAATAFVERSSYTFAEDDANPRMTVVAQMASGMPRGANVRFTVLAFDGSAVAPQDFDQIFRQVTLREDSFVSRNGRWEARRRIRLRLVDDDVREGTEHLRFFTGRGSGDSHGIVVGDSTGTPCPDCNSRVEITDDEDIPDWELSVSAEEISEEEEASSTATLAITNGKTFATDQVVTFAFAGTASEDIDYTVAPEDASAEVSDHQVVLPSDSTSLAVTFTAVDDDIEDSNEEIEVLATLGGDTIGSTRTIRILNQEMLPKITLAASRDTIIAGLETLVLTATREAPLDSPVAVTLQVTQEQNWLSRTSHRLNFAAQGSIANLNLSRSLFSSEVTESGTLTATLDSVSGYDTGDATATVHVVSQAGPAIKVSFAEESYRFAEDEESPVVTLVARAAAGMPHGATFTFSVSARSGTAASPGDYQAVSETMTVQAEDFTLEDGTWQARPSLPLTLVDDDVREGDESFEVFLEMLPGHPSEVQLSDLQGAACRDGCRTPVAITDDEDSPEWELSVSPDEIMEEGETSSTATLSITNGKTFADDQAVTFELGGDAIPGHDYSVTPADADEGVGHQVLLPAGSNFIELTFTAIDDEREEPTEKILLSVTHLGNTTGRKTIRLIDRFPGPRVEITFEGVQPPRDDYSAGVATGPFTTRFTFSEPVAGFTQEDIDWQTHYLTTVDTTTIAVLVWDYTVIREGLEYTAKMMPDQDGRVWIGVNPGAATSVATVDGNQLGFNSLWVDLPPDRLMVAPTELTIDEGDKDGAWFMVVPTSPPTGEVTVTVTGMDGTDLVVDWSTWTFRLPYWNGGWGVTVTAAHDADAADEQVRLQVGASGGGYDGRGAQVVVNIRDDDGASGDRSRDHEPEPDSVEQALILLEGMTPEAAAAALFGEHDLSEAQLAALDMLGNGNGHYDLGDLLSWVALCRSGEANCEQTSFPDTDPLPGAVGGMVAVSRRRRSGHKRQGSPGHRISRSSRIRQAFIRYGAVFLLSNILFSGCVDDDGLVDPRTAQPDPGYLTVQLVAPPGTRDIGAMLLVEGPDIDSVKVPDTVQSSDFEVFQFGTDSSRQIIVSGGLSSGPLLHFRVPDRGRHAEYRMRLLQVAGADYVLRDLARYAVTISP